MMNLSPSPRDRAPWWITVIVIVAVLPVTSLPYLVSRVGPEPSSTITVMLWLYPFYVMLCGWLAWICYRPRPYMTWILIVLMILTHYAMWVLTSPDIQL